MSDSFTVNGDLPLLGSQALLGSDGSIVVQVRCPSGWSMMNGDDAYAMATGILDQLKNAGYESRWLKTFKSQFDTMLSEMSNEEILAELIWRTPESS